MKFDPNPISQMSITTQGECLCVHSINDLILNVPGENKKWKQRDTENRLGYSWNMKSFIVNKYNQHTNYIAAISKCYFVRLSMQFTDTNPI